TSPKTVPPPYNSQCLMGQRVDPNGQSSLVAHRRPDPLVRGHQRETVDPTRLTGCHGCGFAPSTADPQHAQVHSAIATSPPARCATAELLVAGGAAERKACRGRHRVVQLAWGIAKRIHPEEL